ncbi:response regulator [Anaerotruncus colihominis]|jgi:hypothetical protein|uniref:Stage 0 sporulation protein A homolog n=2 Tax=Anaerotruncus colihominis TaxID=169435 RepID=A0A1Y4MS67_9FIRM|nr:response regulator [Anaerotruncus colihominis]OUO67276.1 response regulator [Anaerotruncus colihominis]OUP71547.1 response regulator [Anaerotruncus colihominis]OUP75710.1 response regulator [Anaerotruncus colihominis]RGE65949.1 response regulator [Anaerotruncus colihominis]
MVMKKIMIIDDDTTSLAIAKALLESEYEVVTMQSGLQALGYLQDHQPPELILLDMVMPGTSGMDVLKALKEIPKLADIPVIFLSSMEGMDFEVEGFTHGAEDFIQKPIHAQLLKMKIRRQLYIHQLKEENQLLQRKLQLLKIKIDAVFDNLM